MPYTVVQAGSSLQLISSSGTLTTLTLPTGITLQTDRPPRFVLYDKYIVLVNTPTRPITIDGLGVVRVLTPVAPSLPLTLASGGAGALTGAYKAVQTYVIRDSKGNIISESDAGPVMTTAFVAAANTLTIGNINISSDDITGNNIYRTTAGGSTYFEWRQLDGNVQTTSDADDTSDAGIGLIAIPILGSAPELTLITEWRGRLWGVDLVDVDYIRYTEAGKMYAWPSANSIIVPKFGADSAGVKGLLTRKESLGLGRRNAIRQVTGTSDADFRVVTVTENVGIESQESVVIWQDVAYWLWKDGVYEWGPEGLKCISDGEGGKGNVQSWFTSNSYFTRSGFGSAFAMIIPERDVYRLFFPIDNKFIDFDLVNRTWWGPHTISASAFTPTCTLIRPDANDVLVPTVCSSSGFLFQEQTTKADNGIAIDMNITSKRHSADTPDIDKYWGELSVFGVAQPASGTMNITPSVGFVDSGANTPIAWDLTKSRQRLRRLGTGKHVQLNFRENTLNQDVVITGYEFTYSELGRR